MSTDMCLINDELTMLSTEVVDLINNFRVEEGNRKVLLHSDFMKSIRKEIESLENVGIKIEEGNISLCSYKGSNGKTNPCYKMSKNWIMQMCNKESALVRYKTQQYIESLEQRIQQQESNEKFKSQLLLKIYEGGQAGIIASKQLTELEVQEATAPLIETIEQQAPKVEKYEQYVDSEGFITPTVAAQLLKLPHATAQAFNKLLKEHGIQYKSGKNWVLYEKYNWMLEKDYCKQVPYIDSTGTTHYNLRWTPKGIDYISTNILDVT